MYSRYGIKKPYRVAFVGPSKAGKTSVLCLIKFKTKCCFGPTGQACVETINHHGNSIEIWDIAGTPLFVDATKYQIQRKDLLILFMDPFVEDFAEQLKKLKKQIAGSQTADSQSDFLLIATKSEIGQGMTPAQNEQANRNCERFANAFHLPVIRLKDYNSTVVLDNIVALGMHKHLSRFEYVGLRKRLTQLHTRLSKRFFKPEKSRLASIEYLAYQLRKCRDRAEIAELLIQQARFLRSDDADGKKRYGNFFEIHLRSYQHSDYYQFLQRELRLIDPSIHLDEVSAPTYYTHQRALTANSSKVAMANRNGVMPPMSHGV